MQSVPLYSNYKVVLTAEVFNDADSKKPASNTDAGDYIIYTWYVIIHSNLDKG